MITLAIANVIWAVMWWITMVYTGNGFLPKMTDGVTYGLFGGHIVSLAMAFLFFWQYHRKWKFVKFVTNSQKLFCFFGVTAAFANVGKNFYPLNFDGYLPLMIVADVHNLVLYVALVYVILVVDRVNFVKLSFYQRLSFFLIWLGELMLVLCVFTEVALHLFFREIDDDSSTSAIVISTAFRSWIVFFGKWKLQLAFRKWKRPDCAIFEKKSQYRKASKNMDSFRNEPRTEGLIQSVAEAAPSFEQGSFHDRNNDYYDRKIFLDATHGHNSFSEGDMSRIKSTPDLLIL